MIARSGKGGSKGGQKRSRSVDHGTLDALELVTDKGNTHGTSEPLGANRGI